MGDFEYHKPKHPWIQEYFGFYFSICLTIFCVTWAICSSSCGGS